MIHFRFSKGRQAGHFTGGSGFEQQFLEKIHVIRSQYGAIGDELQVRDAIVGSVRKIPPCFRMH